MTKKKIEQLTASYEERLIESLKDPLEAQAYLETALEDYEKTGKTDSLLLALKDVAKAQGGIGALSQRAGLNREHLYRVLSSKSQPRLDKLLAIVSGLGFRVRLEPQKSMV
ncbi:MAG TPA: transcriptional regulator [Candidatus Latescibacteria bacterium]|nr:transcriptional regulator [Candidatus Latescibacterota bacterium]